MVGLKLYYYGKKESREATVEKAPLTYQGGITVQ
jgi:hypothetical protein